MFSDFQYLFSNDDLLQIDEIKQTKKFKNIHFIIPTTATLYNDQNMGLYSFDIGTCTYNLARLKSGGRIETQRGLDSLYINFKDIFDPFNQSEERLIYEKLDSLQGYRYYRYKSAYDQDGTKYTNEVFLMYLNGSLYRFYVSKQTNYACNVYYNFETLIQSIEISKPERSYQIMSKRKFILLEIIKYGIGILTFSGMILTIAYILQQFIK